MHEELMRIHRPPGCDGDVGTEEQRRTPRGEHVWKTRVDATHFRRCDTSMDKRALSALRRARVPLVVCLPGKARTRGVAVAGSSSDLHGSWIFGPGPRQGMKRAKYKNRRKTGWTLKHHVQRF